MIGRDFFIVDSSFIRLLSSCPGRVGYSRFHRRRFRLGLWFLFIFPGAGDRIRMLDLPFFTDDGRSGDRVTADGSVP